MGERRAWLSPSSFRPLLLVAIFYLRWAGGDGGLVAAYYCCVYVCGGRPSAGGRARVGMPCWERGYSIPPLPAVWCGMPLLSIRLHY